MVTEIGWMQQVGATPKAAPESLARLQKHFPGRLTRLKGDTPYSRKFVASFLWDYLKDRVYKEKLRITEALKTAVAAESARLLSEMADRSVSPLQTVRGAAAGANSPKVARIEHLF